MLKIKNKEKKIKFINLKTIITIILFILIAGISTKAHAFPTYLGFGNPTSEYVYSMPTYIYGYSNWSLENGLTGNVGQQLVYCTYHGNDLTARRGGYSKYKSVSSGSINNAGEAYLFSLNLGVLTQSYIWGSDSYRNQSSGQFQNGFYSLANEIVTTFNNYWDSPKTYTFSKKSNYRVQIVDNKYRLGPFDITYPDFKINDNDIVKKKITVTTNKNQTLEGNLVDNEYIEFDKNSLLQGTYKVNITIDFEYINSVSGSYQHYEPRYTDQLTIPEQINIDITDKVNILKYIQDKDKYPLDLVKQYLQDKIDNIYTVRNNWYNKYYNNVYVYECSKIKESIDAYNNYYEDIGEELKTIKSEINESNRDNELSQALMSIEKANSLIAFQKYQNMWMEYVHTQNDLKQKEASDQTLMLVDATSNTSSRTLTQKDLYLSMDIGGMVFEDINQNGYKDTNESLLKNAKITLYKGNGQQVTTNINGQTITNPIMQNNNGIYKFEYLPIADESTGALINYYVEFEYDGVEYEATYNNTGGLANNRSYANENGRNILNDDFKTIDSEKITARTDYNYITANTGQYTINSGQSLNYVNIGLIPRKLDLRIEQKLTKITIKVNGEEQTYNYNYNPKNIGTVDHKIDSTYIYERPIIPSDVNTSILSNYGIRNTTNDIQINVTYTTTVINQNPNYYIKGNLVNVKLGLINYYDSKYIYTSGDNWNGGTENMWEYKKQTTSQTDIDVTGGNKTLTATYKLNTTDANLNEIKNGYIKLHNFVEIYSYTTTYKDVLAVGLVDSDSDPGELSGKNVNFLSTEAFVPQDNNLQDDEDYVGLVIYTNYKIQIIAPPVEKTVHNRSISGNVWEDITTSVNITDGSIRKGNGIKDNTDISIAGVQVDLMEIGGQNGTDISRASTVSGTDGKYTISGFLPGKYYIKYTYGTKIVTTKLPEEQTGTTTESGTLLPEEQTGTTTESGALSTTKKYSGQDYKSTLYNESKHELTKIGTKDKGYWYYDKIINISDAMDNLNTRKTVNNYSTTLKNDNAKVLNYENLDTLAQNTKMDAKTNEMYFPLDYQKVTSEAESRNELTDINYTVGPTVPIYLINNINFSIAEKPRSELTITKNVTKVKLVTSDNQIIFDNTGPTQNLSWIKDHSIYATVDNNLLHGAKLEITYDISIKNTGEVDYIITKNKETTYDYYNDDFYKIYYNTSKTNTLIPQIGNWKGLEYTKVTTAPNTIIDYIANNLNFDVSKNSEWDIIDVSDLQKGKPDAPDTTSLVDDTISKLDNNIKVIVKANASNKILTEKYDKNKNKVGDNANLLPGESTGTSKLVLSKTLSPSESGDELKYDNVIEIVQSTNTVGRRSYSGAQPYDKTYCLVSIPGNLDPVEIYSNGKASTLTEPDSDNAETVTILEPFGSQKIIYIIIALIITTIFGMGIFTINKRVLKKRKTKD